MIFISFFSKIITQVTSLKKYTAVGDLFTFDLYI